MTRIPRHATKDGFDALPDADMDGLVRTPFGWQRADNVPHEEIVPTLARSVEALIPLIRIWGDQGYPGLTSRQRDEANNARADVEISLGRMLR